MPPLTQEEKDKRKETLKSFFSPESIQGYSQAIIGLGTSIADTTRDQKIKKAQTKSTLEDIKRGGSVSASSSTETQAPAPSASGSDTILGMSKPIFFGGIGVLVLVAGVGIFLATRSSSAAPAQ
jgi:hypothetical protein